MHLMTKKSIIDIANRDFDDQLVSIDGDAVARFSLGDKIALPSFSYANDPGWSLAEQAAFWIYCSAQAFQFWTRNDDGSIERFKYKGLTGSNAMFLQIKDCWNNGGIPGRVVSWLFANSPDADKRIAIGHELSSRLTLNTVALSIVEAALKGKLGIAEADLLQTAFPLSFSDPYLKKAQLAVFAIGRLVEEDRDSAISYDLTAFADYQVPRVLRAHGILVYSPPLARYVDNGHLIQPGSAYELAIRAATVLAVEQLAEVTGAPSAIVDNALWTNQEAAKDMRFHLTKTTHY
jgi:hypothetical protein